MSQFDAIIIGTGQSGPALAAKLVQSGMKVAIIERGHFGGTCVNNGCSPTKTLIASAKVANTLYRAPEYGIDILGEVKVDMARIYARKDEIVSRFSSGVEKWLEELEDCTVIRGHATFKDPTHVRVDGKTYSAKRFFLNVGGKAHIPHIPGLENTPYYTNASIMKIDFLPKHLIILGGGYIALEFAQMYRRFGSEVTVIQRRSRVLPKDDEDISSAITGILAKDGINILVNANTQSISHENGEIKVSVQYGVEQKTIIGSHLLVAIGRIPNTYDLGLEHTEVDRDERGFIRVDKKLKTTQHNIWAIGDCNGKGAFTHTSYNDYEIVAENLVGKKNRKVTDRIPTYALFIDPPLGRVGITEMQACELDRNVLMGKMPMNRVSRAIEKGETEGFMKILVDAKSHRILGAALLGTGCDEVVHLITVMMYAKAPYHVLQDAMHIHPTVSELIPTLLGNLQPLAKSPKLATAG